MYFTSVPDYLKPLFGKDLVWKIDRSDPVVYLTFDDGPVKEATLPILHILNDFGVKATFFCVGENVFHHHDLYLDILSQGHATGNHTYNHLNGWKTDTRHYVENVARCNELLNSKLFRPPYGRMKKDQIRALKHQYSIIMWTCLAGDFDKKLSRETCLERLKSRLSPGSILVLHDNIKTREMITFVLPAFLEYALTNSWRFEILTAADHEV